MLKMLLTPLETHDILIKAFGLDNISPGGVDEGFDLTLVSSDITCNIHVVNRICIVHGLVLVADGEAAVCAKFEVVVRHGHLGPNDFMGVISAITVPSEPGAGILTNHITLQCDICPLAHDQLILIALKLHEERTMATYET